MINKGNKKIKTLHKGDKLVTRVFKGDELIYIDIDAIYSFKFTVAPQYTSYSQTGGDMKVNLQLPQSYNLDTSTWQAERYAYFVDWGDGTTSEGNNNTVSSHTYSTAGKYQVTISPRSLSGGKPVNGWLSNFRLGDPSKLVSIDKQFPEGSFYFSGRENYAIGNNADGGYVSADAPRTLQYAHWLESVPDNLFDNVAWVHPQNNNLSPASNNITFYQSCRECSDRIITNPVDPIVSYKKVFEKVDTSGRTDFGSMFYRTFYNAPGISIPSGLFDFLDTSSASNMSGIFNETFSTTSSNNGATIPADLFANIDTSNATDFGNIFNSTFVNYAYKNTSATIPAGLFDFLDMSSLPSGNHVSQMFRQTFNNYAYKSTVGTIPSGLLDNVSTDGQTNLSSFFYYTFAGYAHDSTVATIPADLFTNIDTTSNTNFTAMFRGVFSQYGTESTTLSIPATIFSFLDMTNATAASEMFAESFREVGKKNPNAVIPDTLLSNVDVSNCLSLSSMFYYTFDSCCYSSLSATIPATISSNLNTSNATSFSSMFSNTFRSCCYSSTVATVPATIFSSINTSNATSVENMFSSTFGYCCYSSTVATIPATLFSNIDTSNATNVSNLFSITFNACCYSSAVATIPSGLFSGILTPKAKRFDRVFYQTFTDCCYSSPVATIPAGLFSSFDTSLCTSFSYSFSGTFRQCCYSSTVATIPADLFDFLDMGNLSESGERIFNETFSVFTGLQNQISIPTTLFSKVDLSGAPAFYHPFDGCFAGIYLIEVPEGIFHDGCIPQGGNSFFSGAFNTSSIPTEYQTYNDTVLKDPFANMTDFSWVNASNASNHLGSMFAGEGGWGGHGTFLTGSASTVLQHFNFTPTNTTRMFQGQTYLADYNTINAKWK